MNLKSVCFSLEKQALVGLLMIICFKKNYILKSLIKYVTLTVLGTKIKKHFVYVFTLAIYEQLQMNNSYSCSGENILAGYKKNSCLAFTYSFLSCLCRCVCVSEST